MGAQLQSNRTDRSEIATLDRLELHLSHAPTRRASMMEEYFCEINYSSFTHKPQKNGNSAKLQANFHK